MTTYKTKRTLYANITEEATFETARECADYIAENIDEEVFAEMLDECYEPVNICGYVYSPSIALERVDPIAYRCAMSDHFDALASDIVYDLERGWDGCSYEWYGIEVEVIESEEE